MADNTPKVSFDVMLVECGMLTNGLSPYATCVALAERIEREQGEAMGRGDYQLTMHLSPFEAGLVLQGLAQAQNTVCDDLIGRVHRAIVKVIDDLGITVGPGREGHQAGGLIDDVQPQPLVDEPANNEGEQGAGSQSDAADGNTPDQQPPLSDGSDEVTQGDTSADAPAADDPNRGLE